MGICGLPHAAIGAVDRESKERFLAGWRRLNSFGAEHNQGDIALIEMALWLNLKTLLKLVR